MLINTFEWPKQCNFLNENCQWEVALLVQYYFNDFHIMSMKFKILCVCTYCVYFPEHFFASLDVLPGSCLFRSFMSCEPMFETEMEKWCRRLQGSLNNLMTDKLATPNKIKPCSVLSHILLLQVPWPESPALVWYLQLSSCYGKNIYAKILSCLLRRVILLGMWFSTAVWHLIF